MTRPALRYHWTYCTSLDRAREIIEDGYATGELDQTDEPRIDVVRGINGRRYYEITLRDKLLEHYA